MKRQTKTKITAILLAIAMVFTMIPASMEVAWAAGYDFQPTDADDSSNSLKMLEPERITPITETGAYCMNQIEEKLDGTREIRFTFTMSAGMNSFNESGFLKNNMPLIKIYDEAEQKVLAEYSDGHGLLEFLGTHVTEETNNHGSRKTDKIFIGLPKETLSSGDYVLVFGRKICGNNTSKILGKDIKFRFSVTAAPELSTMIQQARDFLEETKNKIDNSQTTPDTYTEAARQTLQTAIDSAAAKKTEIEQNSSLTEAQKKTALEQESTTLYTALRLYKESRCVIMESIAVKGIGQEVQVGDKGSALAEVKVLPDEDQYKRVEWSCSGNLTIDSASGAWQANRTGEAWIQATSRRDPGVSGRYEFQISTEPGVLTVNLYNQESTVQDMVEQTLAASGETPDQIKSLKVFTSNAGSMKEDDFAYIRNTLTGLETLDLKNTSVTKLPRSAFSDKTSLTKVVLPDTLQIIDLKAFYHCSGLAEIELPAGLTSIGSGAFAGCTSLPQELTVWAVYPPTYATNGTFGSAFNGTASDPATPVKAIRVPYSCEGDYKAQAGWKVFSTITPMKRETLKVNFTASGTLQQAIESTLDSRGLREEQVTDLIITSPKNVQLSRAVDIAYLQKHFLYATTLDFSETQFEDNKCNANTFKDRISMKYIRMPDSTTTIGGSCFANCKNLREIILPESLGNMGAGAFSNCNKLGSRMVVNASEPPTYSGAVFPDCITTIAVPPRSIEKYKNAVGWSQYRNQIISQITLSLSKSSITLQAPATAALTARTEKYGGDSDDVTIRWSSSNTSVASVSPAVGTKTTVTAKKPGTSVITACDASGIVKKTCKVTVKALPAPAVKASAPAYNKVKVTWSGVTGAKGYEVFRASKKNGTYTKIQTLTASARSYTDTGRATGTTYYYKVRAYKTSGNTRYAGSYSSVVSAKPALAKVTGLKAVKGGSRKIKVTWKKVTGASGYTVYQSKKKSSGYKAVKTVKSVKTLSWTTGKLNKGKTCYFKVRAYRTVNGKKVYGAYSQVVSRKVS